MADAPYPNRLGECMREARINDPQLADLANTTKQQIFKLRRGERKLTVEWARRLAEPLGVPWQALIEATAGAPPAGRSPGYGQRLTALRIERQQADSEFAREIGVPVELLRLWEAEVQAPDLPGLARLRGVGVSADWLFFGDQRRPDAGPAAAGRPRPARAQASKGRA